MDKNFKINLAQSYDKKEGEISANLYTVIENAGYRSEIVFDI